MNHGLFKAIFVISILLLTGCKQDPYTYDYLMLHPSVLQREMTKCQMATTNTDTQCDVIKRAINDFSVLVGESQSNPEQFGDKILKAQMKLQDDKGKFNVQVMLAVMGVMRIE